jgi:tetratricopeptide (TPR) repeat protein
MNTTLLVALLSVAVLGQHVAVVPLDALDPPPDEPTGPPATVLIDRLDVELEPGAEAGVTLAWTLTALEPGWVDLAVVGNELTLVRVTLDGRPVALPPQPDGKRRLTAQLDGVHRLELVGSLPTPDRRISIPTLTAARGTVRVEGQGWDTTVEGALPDPDGGFDLPPTDRLVIAWKPAQAAAARPVVVTAEAGTALRVDDAGVEGLSVLRFRIRHGDVDSLSFGLAGAVEELSVEGAAVRSFERRAGTVHVQLTRAMRGAAILEVSYRTPTPEGDGAHPVPLPAVDGGWVSVLRGDDALVVPEPGSSLKPTATRALPRWAVGLADGETISAYRAGRDPSLAVRVLRYDPVEQPPTLVDEARYEVAYAEHGRLMLRARYQVRNDRNQYLHVVPPTGFELVGALVTGAAVQPVSDGAGGNYVPLEKSIETLHGLVAFPVEVLFLGDEEDWSPRGKRQLLTPAIDAPIAYARWEVILPPGYEAEGIGGGATEVEHWTDRGEGLTYGRAYGEGIEEDEEEPVEEEEMIVRALASMPGRYQRTRRQPARRWGWGMPKAAPAPDEEPARDLLLQDRRRREDASQDAWNQAYNAYKDNAFDEAKGLLIESLGHDPDNAQAQALMANVDVLLVVDEDGEPDLSESTGSKGDQGGEVMVRRVREMARARTGSTEVKQDRLKKKAEEAYRAGDLDAALSDFQALVEVTEKLAQVEQAESYDQKLALEDFQRQLSDIEESVDELKEREFRSSGRVILLEDSLISGTVASGDDDGRDRDRDRDRIVAETTPMDAHVTYEHTTEIDFSDITIDGQLVAPQGATTWSDDGEWAATGSDLGFDLPPDAFVQYDVPLDPAPEPELLPEPTELFLPTAGDANGDAFIDLDGLQLSAGEVAIVTAEPAQVRVTATRGSSSIRGHRGSGSGQTTRSGGLIVRGEGDGKAGGARNDRGPATSAPAPRPATDATRRPAKIEDRPELDRGDQTIRVTAATLSTEVPRAGASLLFEQRLVPENEPLTAELRFRSTARRNR